MNFTIIFGICNDVVKTNDIYSNFNQGKAPGIVRSTRIQKSRITYAKILMKKHIKPNTLVRIMLNKYGEPYLRNLWQTMGAYKAAEFISNDMHIWCTPGRFEYLAKIHSWRRKIRPDLPIALGVARGTTKKEQYPHVIFPGDDEYEN